MMDPEQPLPFSAAELDALEPEIVIDDVPPRIGDWRLAGVLGIGGMGTVFAAEHVDIGKRAAIKVVRAGACGGSRGRLLREAQVVNEIGHPGIVDIFQVGLLDDGRPYLVMELLEGRTLARRLASGVLPAAEAVDLLLALCDALAAAHARGVVHRDLKPDNVFLAGAPGAMAVKLVDWGIAKRMEAGGGATRTRTGTLVGTPRYMAPEQARGREVDARADVYSLGVIAYELFLGAPPFDADNAADLVAMQLREPPPPPELRWPDVPPRLARLLLSMLAKDACDRPSLQAVATALWELAPAVAAAPPRPAWADPGGGDGLARAPTWTGSVATARWHGRRAHRVAPARRQASRRRAALGALVAFGIVAAAVLALLGPSDGDGAEPSGAWSPALGMPAVVDGAVSAGRGASRDARRWVDVRVEVAGRSPVHRRLEVPLDATTVTVDLPAAR